MSDIKIFEHEEFGQLEVLWVDDKAYFPAVKCAEILGYANPHDAIRRHCKGCVKHELPTGGGKQKKNFISEGNLYRLIVRSKLESAQRFEEFVFDVILPSIRRYGVYAAPEAINEFVYNPEYMIKVFTALLNEQKKNQILKIENDKLSCKAAYLDKILQSKTAMPITVISKDYGMSAVAFNALLFYLGVQYRLKSGTWVLYQEYAGCGYTKTVTYQFSADKTAVQMLWTQKGRQFLYNILLENGYLPLCEQTGGEAYS